MRVILIVTIIICFTHDGFCQPGLIKMLNQADTVLIISHKVSSASTSVLVVDSADNKINQPDLFIGNELNNELIVERKILAKNEIPELVSVLTYGYKPTDVHEERNCFSPHHTIIIIKRGRISFIDLCFSCHDFDVSPDIVNLEIRDRKWSKLRALFKKFGFKYEL